MERKGELRREMEDGEEGKGKGAPSIPPKICAPDPPVSLDLDSIIGLAILTFRASRYPKLKRWQPSVSVCLYVCNMITIVRIVDVVES